MPEIEFQNGAHDDLLRKQEKELEKGCEKRDYESAVTGVNIWLSWEFEEYNLNPKEKQLLADVTLDFFDITWHEFEKSNKTRQEFMHYCFNLKQAIVNEFKKRLTGLDIKQLSKVYDLSPEEESLLIERYMEIRNNPHRFDKDTLQKIIMIILEKYNYHHRKTTDTLISQELDKQLPKVKTEGLTLNEIVADIIDKVEEVYKELI